MNIFLILMLAVVGYIGAAFFVSFIAKNLGGKMGLNQKVCSWGSFVCFLALAAMAIYFINPLPSDEKMIKNFHDNESFFNDFVSGYRNAKSAVDWGQKNDLKMKSVGIKRINVSGQCWFDRPYSIDSAKEFDKFRRERAQKKEIEGLYKVCKPLRFIPVNGEFFSFRYLDSISKFYVHFPVYPRIENGILLGPVNDEGINLGNEVVLEDLNGYPSGLEKGTCLFKKIDEQWFLRLCRY